MASDVDKAIPRERTATAGSRRTTREGVAWEYPIEIVEHSEPKELIYRPGKLTGVRSSDVTRYLSPIGQSGVVKLTMLESSAFSAVGPNCATTNAMQADTAWKAHRRVPR
jgi:hypothetical protein